MSDQNTNNSELQPGEVQIRLMWGSTKELPVVYVNQVLITNSPSEFYLTFGELIPPAVGIEDIPDSLEIIPKVRLVISPPAMMNIARVVQDSVQKHTSRDTQTDDHNSAE